MSAISPDNLDKVSATLEGCACRGERCPQNNTHGIAQAAVSALARAGRIRIEISGQNWRQVFILAGPHAGKATAANPLGARAWKIIGANGTRVNGRLIVPRSRRQPSAPRALSARELKR